MARINDLEDVLDRVRLSAARDVNVAIPATIVAYDATQQRASIRFGVFLTDTQGRKRAYPDLTDVPVIFPTSSKSAITFPLATGDTGLYVVTNNSIENWVYNNSTSPVNVEDTRVHDLQDGYFILGGQPFSLAPNNPSKHTLPHSTSDLSIVHNLGTGEEAEVRITPVGAVTVTGVTSTTMQVGSNYITIDQSKIELKFGSSVLKLSASGIELDGTRIDLN
jgi:hypothetical protein